MFLTAAFSCMVLAQVVIMGDGQATQNDFIVKPNVRKVRRIGPSAVGGFAGVAVDGLALLEKLEAKLEEHPGQLLRASVELAKMWRQVRRRSDDASGKTLKQFVFGFTHVRLPQQADHQQTNRSAPHVDPVHVLFTSAVLYAL
jgi:ATP-dependent protease HslVU (ClpYQ) peptidase subunit